MRSTYLNILTRYTIALILSMFFKIIVIDCLVVDNQRVVSIRNEKESKYSLKYTESNVSVEDGTFKKPLFNVYNIDKFISDYITDNSCKYLEYNIIDLDNSRINVFLNCGTPQNLIYDYMWKKELTINDLTRESDKFEEKERELLKLKYPKFVVDDVDFSTAAYNIKHNELVGFYKTNEFGEVNVRINYNEIKDMLNYVMHYDESYENEVYTLDPNKKTISFTFDDGPSGYDLELVDLLVDSHSSATFFVVGNRLESFPNSIKKMVDTGMEVGNHTYNHKSLTGLSNTALLNQITKTNDLFYQMTGKNLEMLRPSYGAVNKRVLIQVGVPVILWNIDTLDWKTRDAEKVYNEIMASTDGDIVLMHSLYKSTVDAVEKSLKELYKRGYQVVSVSKLAELKGKTITPGVSYLAFKQ